ncbi:PREDICTED: uncharacterized protein LOC109329438 isoform X2 [Lupinus angustifolius]|uniref:uncharacterized protein LOC109329438 isoform X2 n=1 Tax=Lupinus angustifolius TaxID=3871 RepID=UPI00092F27EF|nr:PREDICTED: uncharacterized protein LOC109329438 isoform X2 [Lupinus angustifolius]
MDLETENRLAAMLMREAAELRRQSQKEGVLAYLCKPNVRGRPNSRFLSATIRGVQQANRAVEVNEMWRLRQKELELDERVKGTSKDKSNADRSHRDGNSSSSPRRHAFAVNSSTGVASSRSTGRHAIVDDSTGVSASCSSKRQNEHSPEGLKDEELEEFLHSRKKRGRGGIGPRMDETGPYLPPPHPYRDPSPSPDAREHRVIYGPARPPSLKSCDSSEEELHEERRKKIKKSHAGKSEKEHSKKSRSKEKSKHKKKKRGEKTSKHYH